MKLGVIADVHGNLHALERVLDLLRDEAVETYLCAGDLVGYGPYPNECIERLFDLGVVCVAGNHDLIAASRLAPDGVGALARRTLDWTATELLESNLRLLRDLPLRAEVGPVVMAHGSIDDPRRYVPADQVAGELDRLTGTLAHTPVLVLGHTHHPFAYGSASGQLVMNRSGKVRFERGEALALNPGSVGQSRERRPVARFAILDLERREVDVRDTTYDHAACRRALRQRGLPGRASHQDPNGLRARLGRFRRRVGLARPARDREAHFNRGPSQVT